MDNVSEIHQRNPWTVKSSMTAIVKMSSLECATQAYPCRSLEVQKSQSNTWSLLHGRNCVCCPYILWPLRYSWIHSDLATVSAPCRITPSRIQAKEGSRDNEYILSGYRCKDHFSLSLPTAYSALGQLLALSSDP